MKRNRYILCLLVCGYMLYYAVPRLSVTAPGAQGLFSAVWLMLALFAIAGNLTGILYFPNRNVQRKTKHPSSRYGKKTRSYH